MNNNNNIRSYRWAILPLLFCSAAVLAGEGGYDGTSGQAPLTLEGKPDTMHQATSLGQESDGFLEDSSATSTLNTGFVGGDTRIGIGVDTEFKGKVTGHQVFTADDNQAVIGEAYVGFNPDADEDAGEETLTGAGAKLNYHWVATDADGQPAYVNKVFGAYDQNEQEDKKVSIGYGQENQELFWSGHVSKGISDARDVAPGVVEKGYDYGVGGRVGAYLPGPAMRIQGGVDYEWGEDFADNEERPEQVTVSGGLEKFFPDSPHSIGADVEVYKKSGGILTADEEDADVRGGISYRYDIGSEAGVWQPNQRFRRVRVEIPGQEINTPPKVERKLVKNTMELEADTFFKVNSARLTPEARTRLDAIAGQIRASGHEGNIRITGNTCDVGSLQHNQKLSERRAASVKDYLAQKGFSANELIALGLGETQPKYPNTPAERHKNRRVDIEYVSYQTKYKDEVIQQGGTSRTDPKVVWRKELIPEPPIWVRQALRNTADHKQRIDTYRTTAGATDPNAPVAVNDSATTSSGTPVSIDVLGNDSDPNGDVLTIASFNQGTNGSVTQVGDELVYTPVVGFVGVDTFTYTITDPDGNLSTATVSVTVTAGTTDPNAPVAGDDIVSTDEDVPVTINVLGNDSDPNGDVLTIASFNQGTNGSVTQVGDDLVYTPVAGFNGTDSFTYIVTDPDGNQDTATVTVIVNATGPNTPVTVNDTATTSSGVPVSIDVLGNDSDPNGDLLAITSFTQGGNGSVTQVGDDLVYTPGNNFVGTDTFVYTVSDPDGNQSTATVTVTVTPGGTVDPNAPVAVNDTAVTTAGTPVSVDVTANDSDPNGDPLAVTDFTQGGNGSVTMSGDELVYTPDAGFTGTDTFTYTITDINGDSATGTVTVTVSPAGGVINANDDLVETIQETPVSVDVLANDSVPAGTAISSFGQGTHGTVTADGDNLLYTPNAGFAGDDRFDYVITDAEGNASTATVFIRVTTPGGGLDASTDLYTVNKNSSSNVLDILSNDELPDNGSVTVEIISGPTNGSASVSGSGSSSVINYTPATDYSGLDQLTYRLTDYRGYTSEGVVDITVADSTGGGSNLAPSDDYLLIALNDTVTRTLDVLANDFGDDLEIIAVGTPRYGTAVVSPDGKSINFTLRSGYCTDHSFTYVVRDSAGNEASAMVIIDVEPANIDDPTDPNGPPG